MTGKSLLDDLAHHRLDALEVLRSERLIALEVVVEAVGDRRADGDLHVGEQPFDRLRHQVCRRVAQDIEPFG